MKVEHGTVVSLLYTLTDDEGTILDSTAGGEPLDYLHGYRNIIVGLEEALDRMVGSDPSHSAAGQRL